MQQQICSKCNQPKEMKEFSKKASSSNGYSGEKKKSGGMNLQFVNGKNNYLNGVD